MFYTRLQVLKFSYETLLADIATTLTKVLTVGGINEDNSRSLNDLLLEVFSCLLRLPPLRFFFQATKCLKSDSQEKSPLARNRLAEERCRTEALPAYTSKERLREITEILGLPSGIILPGFRFKHNPVFDPDLRVV